MKTSIFTAKTFISFSIFLCGSTVGIFGQENPPAPGAPKAGAIPAIHEKTLPNGLTVAVVQKRTVPLVTVSLLVKSGAVYESAAKAGLADITASMLTKGTKRRTATQIAEAVEFLGGSINSGAGWNNSFVSLTVTSDKLAQAMDVLSDVVLNPVFSTKELDLLKSQTLDELTANLKQPSFIASYVGSKYSFGEHPAGGTPPSIQSITRADVAAFHKENFLPTNAVLIFTGDITDAAATSMATRAFGRWKRPAVFQNLKTIPDSMVTSSAQVVRRMLVVDLPKSGQAAVNYLKPIDKVGRSDKQFYPASVLNAVLGGGYSSRLNLEIRIKRGLSYGAGSNFAWRSWKSNFSTSTQTKNLSAAEVAELVVDELRKLGSESVSSTELVPRKSVLTGSFGRNLETTSGLATALANLYAFGIPATELGSYVPGVNAVTDAQIREFARNNILGGDMIIVGDYAIFKDDLAKRFPDMKINVIKADDLDLSKDSLSKY